MTNPYYSPFYINMPFKYLKEYKKFVSWILDVRKLLTGTTLLENVIQYLVDDKVENSRIWRKKESDKTDFWIQLNYSENKI